MDLVPVLRALAALALGYSVLLLAHSLWAVDFRWWVLAVKPLASWHWPIVLAYLPVLLLGFASIGLALHLGLPHDARRAPVMVLRNVALLAGPFALLLAIQYGSLFAGFSLPLGQPLMTIVAIQFALVLVFVAASSTVLFHVWRRIWPGAVLNAGFVGWLVVAGTATAA